MSLQIPYTTPGHQADIGSIGWGEPPTYYPRCICGWTGTPIESRMYPGDDEAEYNAMIEPYRSQLRRVGITDWRGEDGTRYGTYEDAVNDCLDHLNYDQAAHLERLVEEVKATHEMLVTFTATATPEAFAQMSAATEALSRSNTDYATLNPNLITASV